MGFSLKIQEESWSNEDQRWLGGAHGTETCDSITLDADLFLAAFPDGVVPSGVVLGKITATGLYGPYSNAAADGRQTAVGFLYKTTDLRGKSAADAQDMTAALFWHGEIVESFLPVGHGLDAAARAELTQIRFS